VLGGKNIDLRQVISTFLLFFCKKKQCFHKFFKVFFQLCSNDTPRSGKKLNIICFTIDGGHKCFT